MPKPLSSLLRPNEGGPDRTVRVVVGVAVLMLGLASGSWWGLLGLVPLLTGAAGFCPLYALFGFSTCPAGRRSPGRRGA